MVKVSNKFYALKTIKWMSSEKNKIFTQDLADEIVNEKKIGIIARESRFLVDFIISFQSWVN